MTRCLRRINFVSRKNSIGQVVPDNWRELAEETAERIRKNLADCDVIVNADQTFVKLYMESDFVLAPVGTKRVGGKVDTDKKAGFTIMVTVEMARNIICNPFIVFTGMKQSEAKQPTRTLDYKYQSWKGTATVAFQKKHWFDHDITIRWLNWLKDQFPNMQVGLIWDHAPAHINVEVSEYLDGARDWLRTELIPGGLTSVLQVCDLIVNKDLKNYIRDGYYRWRTQFVKDKRREGVSGKLKVKIPRDILIDIIEKAVKKMNRQQQQNPTIRKMFKKAGQDPFMQSIHEFKQHLDSLSKDSMYKTIINNQQSDVLSDKFSELKII